MTNQTTYTFESTPSWLETSSGECEVERDNLHCLMNVTGTSTFSSFSIMEPTSDRLGIAREMDVLEAIAHTQNDPLFLALIQSMNWQNRPAEDYVRVVRLALTLGIHPVAWKLAEEGNRLYSENPELHKLAHILAPAKVIDTHLPSDPNASMNVIWLKQHRAEYRGRWVALKAGELLAVGSHFKELVGILGNPKGTQILITMVY